MREFTTYRDEYNGVVFDVVKTLDSEGSQHWTAYVYLRHKDAHKLLRGVGWSTSITKKYGVLYSMSDKVNGGFTYHQKHEKECIKVGWDYSHYNNEPNGNFYFEAIRQAKEAIDVWVENTKEGVLC